MLLTCSYTALGDCEISTYLTTGNGFISTKLFVLKIDFDVFAEIHEKKMFKKYML